MFRRGNNNADLKKALIARCNDISEMADKASQENLIWADFWGKIHICLGIATICFSSLSAIFTFYDKQFVVVTLCILSTIMASCTTFLNPSFRENRRRGYHIGFFTLKQTSDYTKLLIEASSMQEDILIKRVEDLNKQLEKLMHESYHRRID